MNTIIDTGPIVAFLDKNEEHHRFVMEKMSTLKAPFYTCEAVLSETLFLIRKGRSSQQKLLELLESGKLRTTFQYTKNVSRVNQVIVNYRNLLASFADACLVAMAEKRKNSSIFTLDDDFAIYRDTSGNPFSLIAP